MPGYNRRRFLQISATAATGVVAASCSGSSLGGGEASDDGPVKIGLIWPESGVYKALGDDQRNGWQLYLDETGGKLGGREVELVSVDEGDVPETAKSGAEKLLKRDRVTVAVGVISSASLLAISPLFESAKVPLISTNASPTPVQGKKWGWRTSFYNNHAGVALGTYVARNVDGPVALVAADYAAGQDFLAGMTSTFEPAGGAVAGKPIMVPFPNKGSWTPYLQQIEQRKPKAVFAFFAGADAVGFVKEYRKFGLAEKYPLYAPGFLTEGGALQAQGKAAEGIFTALHYAPGLENEANKTFAAAYTKAYDVQPTCYAVAAYDAARILDEVIRSSGEQVTSARLESGIGRLGEIDSPRGPWRFADNRSPEQMWYLREVRQVDGSPSNVVVDELETLGD